MSDGEDVRNGLVNDRDDGVTKVMPVGRRRSSGAKDVRDGGGERLLDEGGRWVAVKHLGRRWYRTILLLFFGMSTTAYDYAPSPIHLLSNTIRQCALLSHTCVITSSFPLPHAQDRDCGGELERSAANISAYCASVCSRTSDPQEFWKPGASISRPSLQLGLLQKF